MIGEIPRSRDGAHRHPGRADGPPRPLDPAHQQRGGDDNPSHRHGRRTLPAGVDGQGHPRAKAGAPAVPTLLGAARTAAPSGPTSFAAQLEAAEIRDAADIRQAHGCDLCGGTGFAGRTTIAEILPLDPAINSLVASRASDADIERLARERGMTSMYANGMGKAWRGLTTVEEVLRATRVVWPGQAADATNTETAMKSPTSSYLRQLGLTSPAGLLIRFRRWWIGEFVGLFPARMAEWLTGKDRRRLVVSLEPSRVGLEIQDGGGQARIRGEIDRSRYSPACIDQFLAGHALRRADIEIAVRLDHDRIFQRRFPLPLEARSAIEEVALRDLTRKTPFKPADIYHDLRGSRTTAGKIDVVQWVARRSIADQAIAALQIAPAEVDCLVADPPADGGPAPLIRLSRDPQGSASWMRAGRIALVATGIALAVALIGGKLWRQELALDDLESQLAEVGPKAQQVRALVSGLERTQTIVYSVSIAQARRFSLPRRVGGGNPRRAATSPS